MFPFKICSAVEFVRIKLWSHQKTEGRDQYFNRWVYFRPTTENLFFPLIWLGKFCVHFWGFQFLLLPPQSVTCLFLRVKLSPQRDSTHSLSGAWGQRPCGPEWVGGFLRTSSFFNLSFKAVDRKNTSTCTKMSSCAFFYPFRCHPGSSPESPQNPGTLFSGPLQDDQPGCWLWRPRLPAGPTPARCSVMLWMTSCPWPAVWRDPAGYRCSACTPSAGSRSVCCHSL